MRRNGFVTGVVGPTAASLHVHSLIWLGARCNVWGFAALQVDGRRSMSLSRHGERLNTAVLGASTTTDQAAAADSEGEERTMTTDTAPTSISDITSIDDTTAERWLADTLGPARQRVKQGPTPDAVARVRARIFEEPATEQKDSRIAA